MNKVYIEKLIKLAEELEDFVVVDDTPTKEDVMFVGKFNYLIGYILAFKEINNGE